MKAVSGVPDDPAEEAAKTAADGYHQLLEYAAKQSMNVIVENHFGNSYRHRLAGWRYQSGKYAQRRIVA
jgi:hypothetical protein